MNEDVRKLSNEMLIKILDKCVELESANEAEIIDFIREVMARRLYLEFGAESMFDFLTRAHSHYAPVVAQRKLDAARVIQAFPQVKDLITSGELNLTQLGMLASALRQKPASQSLQREILEAMRGQTVRSTQALPNEKLELQIKEHTKVRVQRDGSVRAEITFSKEEWESITRAKEIISHSVPSSELNEVIGYCARFTVARKDPMSTSMKEVKVRQCQGVSRPTRRFIFRRDKSCRQRRPDGTFCESRYQLQVDHIQSR